MTVPSLGKFLVPAALAAGAVFSISTAPLALFGSEPITVEMKGTEVFKGSLKDVAAPYLGFAGALSLAVGVTSLALTGWRQSSRQSGKLEQQVSGMQNQLQEKEVQLQELLLSDKSLETTGLQFFLEDEESSQLVSDEVAAPSQPIVQAPAQVSQPIVYAAPSQSILSAKPTVQTAVSPLQAAQAFLSFSRTGTSAKAAVKPAWTQVPPASESTVAQISELQTQLQQIMAQIETLQSNAWVESQPVNSRVTIDSMISSIPQAKQRKLEPQRVMQIVAS
ncbi:hypothetical protein ACKFKF_23585 [Phormidesmis sp. 146-12]